jgi:hypothetical protein
VIHATFPATPVTAADATPGGRTVAGTAVPFGVPGWVSDGRQVIFEPGSIDASARPVLLRDHDRTRPIGIVTAADDHGDRLDATARLSRTRDGDDALVLAADGALGMFSVGAEPSEHYTDDDGVLHVVAADWAELSLLTHGAYGGARVRTVTAATPTREDLPAMSDAPAPIDPVDDNDDDDETTDDETTEQGALVLEAARPTLVPVTAARAAGRRGPGAELTLQAIGPMLQAARAGSRDARNRLTGALARFTVEAALADVTMVGTNNVGGMYRPAYQAEIVELVSHGAPLTEVVRQGDLQRGDFPNKTFLRWTNTPQVGLQATEKADINSTPVGLAPVSVPVQTWATGNDISQQTLDFGPPSFVQEYVRAASVDYAATIDTYAATVLMTAATDVPTVVGDTFVQVIGKLFGALNPANVPAGRMFLAVAWDVASGLIPVTQDNAPAFWTASLDLGNFDTTGAAGGLTMFYDPNLPARTYLLGSASAATWYDTPGVPYTLQAVNVGKLGLDLAVYGYGAMGVQYPGALVKTTQPLV